MAGKTEWEDALIKHGIMEAPKHKETEDERQLKFQESMAEHDPLANKTLDELDELEDEIGDEDVLEAIRRKRLKELQEQAARERFGVVQTLCRADYSREVTEGSKNSPVVCHLFSQGSPSCEVLDRCLASLAAKFKSVKFVRILGSEAIQGYPEARCPTVLVYQSGDMKKQFVGINAFGGQKASPDIVEWVLSSVGILETTLEKNPLESLFSMSYLSSVKNATSFATGSRSIAQGDDEDDEW